MRKSLLSLLLLLPLTAQAETNAVSLPDWAQDQIADLRASCASMENGVLSGERGAFTGADLNADGAVDWIYDSSVIQCSTISQFLCGSGGCEIAIQIGTDHYTYLAYSWELAAASAGAPPVIRLKTNGEDCGLAKAGTCMLDLQWQGSALKTVSSRAAH